MNAFEEQSDSPSRKPGRAAGDDQQQEGQEGRYVQVEAGSRGAYDDQQDRTTSTMSTRISAISLKATGAEVQGAM